jgi:aldose 1-epimerase
VTVDDAFGVTSAGKPVRRWTVDDGDLRLGVLDLGGIIQSFEVPDAGGEPADVVIGFDDVARYERTRTFAGAIIGRFANRLAGGRFTLDGTEYLLEINEGPNTVHGGPVGFHRRIWDVAPQESAEGTGLRLSFTSEDGDQGFPGRLDVVVAYLLVPGQRRLVITYEARTDAPTVVNLTQHSYFNLGGPAALAMLGLDGHTLQVSAGHYTPVDGAGLPRGDEAHVAGTSFDLRGPQPLELLEFDHNFVIDGWDGRQLRPAAVLEHATSGRRLEVLTTEPGLQVYTGNGLDGSEVGKGGIPYRRGAAVALESQHLPDSPNHPAYPSVVLRPGEVFTSRTEWRFG